MLLNRELEEPSHELMKQIYDNDVHVSVFADDDTAAGSVARTLVSAPNLYVPVTGLAGLADSGRKEVKALCEEAAVPPPAVALPCKTEMTADVVLVIDVDSYLTHNSTADFDIATQLLAAFAASDDVRVALVLHTQEDDKPPRVFMATPDVALADIVWNEKHEAHLHHVNRLDAELDFAPTLEFLDDNPVFEPAEQRASRVVIALSARPHQRGDTALLDETLASLATKQISTVFLVPESERHLTESDNDLQTHVVMPAEATPAQEFQVSNAILEKACAAPKRPVSHDLCEASVDVVFVVDGDLLLDPRRRPDVEGFFAAIKEPIGGAVHTVYTDLPGVDMGAGYVVKDLPPSLSGDSDEFSGMPALQGAAQEFTDRPTHHRRLVVTITRRPSADSADAAAIAERLSALGVQVISLTVETPYFLPELEGAPATKLIALTTGELIEDAVAEVLSAACAPVHDDPLPPAPPTNGTFTCPAGGITLLYDVALFSPAREGRKVTAFLKRVLSLIGGGSSFARATSFTGVGFGRDSHVDFAVDTDSYIEMERAQRDLDTMQHRVERFNPPNAGEALRGAIDQAAASSNSKNTVLLLIGRYSYDDLPSAVEYAAAQGVEVITFYIGGLKFADPAVLSTMNYGAVGVKRLYDLKNLEYEILELICTKAPVAPTPEPSPAPMPTPPKPCKVDVIFAIDDLLLHKKMRLRRVRQFMSKMTRYLVFGEDQTRVGAVRVGKKAKDLFGGMVDSKRAFLRQQNRKLRPKAATKPLSYVAAQAEASRLLEKYGRKKGDVKRLIVYVTARQGSDVLDPALLQEDLNNKGIFVAAVTINDASTIPSESLSNFGEHVDAKRCVAAVCC